MIKKLLPVLLILAIALVACGTNEIEVVEKIVEVEVPGEPLIVEKIVEVDVTVEVLITPIPDPTATPSPCPDGWPTDVKGMEPENCPDEWGVLYLKAERNLYEYEILGLNANGLPIFSKTGNLIKAGSIIVVYNTFNGVDYNYDFDELTNAQGFFALPDTDPVEYAKEFPGRWRGDGMTFAYEIAGMYGAGRFVLADHVSIPECGDLILTYPESCDQGNMED